MDGKRLKKAKIYNPNLNVYDAAVGRLGYIFDNFEKVIVSFSGGKDSTALLYMSIEEAEKRKRKIYVFFLDQEFEYQSSILFIEDIMKNKTVIPIWFQIYGILPTAIHHEDYWLYPWNPDEKDKWIRSKKRVAIKKINWKHNVPYSFKEEKLFGFYGFTKTMEQMFREEETAHLIGLRAEESLDRFRAVIKNEGIPGIPWSTRGKYNSIKFYPIYDWTFQDIWVHAAKKKYKYNRMYDFFWKKGYSMRKMRVSSLMNRKSFECLADIQEFEPKLYDKLLERTNGVKTASEYSGSGKIFKTRKLPEKFRTWKEYRDFLLLTYPNKEHCDIFKLRFRRQKKNEFVYRQQVFQLQIHDITNSKKIQNTEDPKEAVRRKWMSEL
jgi:predicted phosphoadenosine phosphosulfate sulfurtransferase